MAAKKKLSDALTMLIDESMPWEHRRRVLHHLLLEGGPEGEQILMTLCNAAAAANGESLVAAKQKELNELLTEMRNGPLRSAVFIKMLDQVGGVRRAKVMLQDGETAFTAVPDVQLAQSLRCGDVVYLEAQGRALLGRDSEGILVGEEARLERLIGDSRVEVTLRDHETHVFLITAGLADEIQAGEVKPGQKLLVCSRRSLAFAAVPAQDGLSHYWFLARDPVPEVDLDRDIANPPAYIAEIEEHIASEMTTPELNRQYRLRRAISKLLAGVSGSGKSLSINAVWRRIYTIMSEVTGVPIEQLPPRVMRLRMPKVLSKWLGDSDKLLDRFFDEVEQLASEKFVAPDGTEWELPVLVIGEEIEGLARQRGEGDPVYDRIQTTALERLDLNCQRLKDRLVCFLFTSNLPQLVDCAFLRRAGGTIERFGRLTRREFPLVLMKHVNGLPFRSDYGRGEQAERRAVRAVTDWLYNSNGHDPGQVSLTFVGSTAPVIKYRRDFLTGALVDSAVQRAAREARRNHQLGIDSPGLTAELLIDSFSEQIASVVNQLSRDNAVNYLTLPDGARVGDVRRIEQPTVQPFELEQT
jgi:hypothetical protein